ncbi:olfactory receptor 1-like [Anomaloglossus baeobatrachus]|uniref:olfactory receptor 1-like n=1 Tax=Anomaloglossus baeobatrachus TaxID=238106 RepID=UPI003F5008DD
MCECNQTEVTEFLLLGFKDLYRFKYLFFIIFLFSYLIIMNGNLLIIVLVSTNHNLNIPMFIFLKHLAVADILITTTIVPMMLNIILLDMKAIPVKNCIIQLYFFFIFGFIQCYLIAIMSYDRYLAICSPMHYNSIMQPHVCLKMVLGTWFFMFFLSLDIVLFFHMEFCGQNVIDHFFCDSRPLIELATSDTYLLVSVDFVFSIILVIIPFTLIIISYIRIFFTIMTLSSTSGRRKAFSTCSSHLTTVCTYYGTFMMVYMVPSDVNSLSTNKFMSLLYLVVTPMMNPIIYSLRNQEIRKTIQQMFKKMKGCN